MMALSSVIGGIAYSSLSAVTGLPPLEMGAALGILAYGIAGLVMVNWLMYSPKSRSNSSAVPAAPPRGFRKAA